MATFVLDGKASANLPRRPVAVSMSNSGSSRRTNARLTVRTRGESPRVVQQSGDMLILPRIDSEITVLALPDGDRDRFDQDTILHVTFGPDTAADTAADVVQLTPRDVSGLSFIELATIEPSGIDALVVKTRLTQPEPPLPPLAARARVACRGVLQTGQVEASDAVALRCVVDTSASMAPAFAAGAVAACGEIIAGIGAVVSPGPQVELIHLGPVADPGRVVDGAALGESLKTLPQRGFGLAADPSVIAAPTSRNTVTIVVTDGPGVVDSAADGSVVSLVISASDSAARRRGFSGAICPPPPSGADALSFLLDRPDQLTRIVEDLVGAAGLRGGAR